MSIYLIGGSAPDVANVRVDLAPGSGRGVPFRAPGTSNVTVAMPARLPGFVVVRADLLAASLGAMQVLHDGYFADRVATSAFAITVHSKVYPQCTLEQYRPLGPVAPTSKAGFAVRQPVQWVWRRLNTTINDETP